MPDSARYFDSIAERYDTLVQEHIRAHYLPKRVRLIGPLLAGGGGRLPLPLPFVAP
jgi:hypothetical protein